MTERPRQGVTIRRSLIRTFVLMIVAIAGVLLVVMTVRSSREVEELSRTLVQRATLQVEGELDGFFDPVDAQIHTMADWGAEGLLPIDPVALSPMMRPIIRREPQVSSLLIARTDGQAYMLMQLDDTFQAREVRPEEWGRAARWTGYRLDGEVTRTWEEADLGYDPRLRPWFDAALEAPDGTPVWTEPYAFFTTRDPGITVSMAYRAPDDASGVRRVAGLDLLLSDISRFTSELEVSEHGRALVIADDGRVIGLPRDPRFEDDDACREAVLQPLEELELPVAATAWSRGGAQEGVNAIDAGGERWWAGLRRYSLGADRTFWILVLVPERDFLERVERERNLVIGVVFAALLVAVLIALWLAQAYSRPLETLAQEAERIRTLDLSPGPRPASRLREVRSLDRAQERMRAAIESFARYVPIEVVRELIRQGDVAKIGGRHAELTMLFTDIEGFTSDSERMSPQEVTEHVGTYFDAMLGILKEEHATVDKLIGDAIMAFWGAPVEDPEQARHAMEAVLRCRAKLAELQEGWADDDLPLLPTRFGLHTGPVMVGNVGSQDRLSYTVLGDAVNLTARLEGANKVYGTRVLCTRAFVDAIGGGYVFRWVDRVAVKGRTGAVDVFEPLGREGEVDEDALAFKLAYEAAWERARDRDFEGALKALEALGDEPSVTLLRKRCARWAEQAPGDDWRGESRLASK